MKCPNCNSEIQDDRKFCGNCGLSLSSESVNLENTFKKKNQFLSVLLNLLIIGFGQAYTGHYKRGFLITLTQITMVLIGSYLFLDTSLNFSVYIFIVPVVFYLWAIIDALTLTKKYNENLVLLPKTRHNKMIVIYIVGALVLFIGREVFSEFIAQGFKIPTPELFFNFVSKPRRSCVFPALRLTLS